MDSLKENPSSSKQDPVDASTASEMMTSQPKSAWVKKSFDKDPVLEAIMQLDPFDPKSISDILQKYQKIAKERAGITSNEVTINSPRIVAKQRILVLPKAIFNSSEFLQILFAELAKENDLSIRLYEDEKTFDRLSEDQENLILGICSIAREPQRNIKVLGNKESPYAEGQALAKGLIISSLFGEANLQKALIKNHKAFANNPGEEFEVNKKKFRVDPYRDHLLTLFGKHPQAKEFTSVVEMLIKGLKHRLNDDAKADIFKGYMMPYNIYVSTYFYRILVVHSGRNKIERKKGGVPSKPKPSPLLHAAEQNIINILEGGIFSEPLPECKDFLAWVETVCKEMGSLSNIDKIISENYRKRTEFLQIFGNLTTKRLQEIRQSLNLGSTKRKADIRPEDLDSCLSQRKDPLGKFAQEILTFEKVADMTRVYGFGTSDKSYKPPSVQIEKLALIKEFLKNQEDFKKKPFVKDEEAKEIPKPTPAVNIPLKNQFDVISEKDKVDETTDFDEFKAIVSNNLPKDKLGKLANLRNLIRNLPVEEDFNFTRDSDIEHYFDLLITSEIALDPDIKRMIRYILDESYQWTDTWSDYIRNIDWILLYLQDYRGSPIVGGSISHLKKLKEEFLKFS